MARGLIVVKRPRPDPIPDRPINFPPLENLHLELLEVKKKLKSNLPLVPVRKIVPKPIVQRTSSIQQNVIVNKPLPPTPLQQSSNINNNGNTNILSRQPSHQSVVNNNNNTSNNISTISSNNNNFTSVKVPSPRKDDDKSQKSVKSLDLKQLDKRSRHSDHEDDDVKKLLGADFDISDDEGGKTNLHDLRDLKDSETHSVTNNNFTIDEPQQQPPQDNNSIHNFNPDQPQPVDNNVQNESPVQEEQKPEEEEEYDPYAGLSPEEREEKEKEEYVWRFRILKRKYRNKNIEEFNEHSDLSTMKKTYDRTVKELYLDDTVESYRGYLCIGFWGLEFVFTNFLGIDMNGFANNQIKMMTKYDRMLVELGEKSYSQWGMKLPVEVRLLGMIIIQGLLFYLGKVIAVKCGSDVNEIFQSLSGSPPSSKKVDEESQSSQNNNSEKKKMRGPRIRSQDIRQETQKHKIREVEDDDE